MRALKISRLTGPVGAAAMLVVAAVFTMTGCDDGCPDGQSKQVAGHYNVWHPPSTTWVRNAPVHHPGYTSHHTYYECRPDS